MEFRKDINGLRALAVLAVVIYHFNAMWLPGGFAGVDVFFVISGYLMTAIICRGVKAHTFSLRRFYIARVKRIVPVLAVMCCTLMVFGWMSLLPAEYKEMAKHVLSSLGFYSNVTYLKGLGYFTASLNERWLLHTWSLSVEWQFYLIYPVALLLLTKLFGLRAFYLLSSRSWELCAGGLAFLFPLSLGKNYQRALEWLGLGLILLGYVVISKAVMWPGYYALLPVVGTVMVIAANRQDSMVTGNPVFQRVGLYSYSIYIWHWPVMVYMSYSGWLSSVTSMLLGVIVSLVLGGISYWLIERKRAEHAQGLRAAAPVTGVVALVLFSLFVYKSDGVDSDVRGEGISEKSAFVNEYVALHKGLTDAYWLKCNTYETLAASGSSQIDASCTRKQGEGGVFLWGDSHAEALSLGIRSSLPEGVAFYQVTSSACGASLTHDSATLEFQATCNASNDFALQEMARLKPDVVVMAQASAHEGTDWNEIARHLKTLGVKNVVLVGPVPQWRPSLPLVMTKRHWKSNGDHIVDQGLDQRMLTSDGLLGQTLSKQYITYISVIERLCEGPACLAKVDNGKSLLVVDYGHLTPAASKYVGSTIILPVLKQLATAIP
ncbi:acyltransferase family protein [Pseudomonas fontis]|uniref:Acyltransferase n=1 Tax=Pseudomonas fontis TaxID=2942633 RepID=A0ABT5NZ16_9PSED|nr:acyltransferase family protein [Pseudomonas fontis]MDD0973983.1 acyltransferase [Pseudomonas fontis]MDD0993349.1 acyltransferase [Pseudomonas fontis]